MTKSEWLNLWQLGKARLREVIRNYGSIWGTSALPLSIFGYFTVFIYYRFSVKEANQKGLLGKLHRRFFMVCQSGFNQTLTLKK